MIVSIYIYRTGASQAWRIQLRNLETFFFFLRCHRTYTPSPFALAMLTFRTANREKDAHYKRYGYGGLLSSAPLGARIFHRIYAQRIEYRTFRVIQRRRLFRCTTAGISGTRFNKCQE